MKVNPSANSAVQSTETSRAKSTNKASDTKDTDRTRATDSVSSDGDSQTTISSKAKEFAKAQSVAQAAPDVREDRIAALKKRIAEGRYNVDPDKIADRMVNEHLSDSIG